jgi:hypothetical protein
MYFLICALCALCELYIILKISLKIPSYFRRMVIFNGLIFISLSLHSTFITTDPIDIILTTGLISIIYINIFTKKF